MKCPDLTVILPTYNEAGHITSLIQSIIHTCHPKEIVVVDDHSCDGTAAKVRSMKSTGTPVRVITHPPPRGLTSSIQTGIDAATGTLVAWMDADFSHPPEVIGALYRALDHADIAVGSTHCLGGCDARSDRKAVFFSRLINTICQFFFGTHIRHYTSGFILAKRTCLHDLPLRGDYGEYCIDVLVRALRQDKTVVEVPYTCTDRKTGTSKTATSIWGFFRRGRKYLSVIGALWLSGGSDGEFDRKY